MNDGTEWASCPYDKAHRVPRERLQRHLTACRKQNLHKNFQICKFDTMHHIPPEEYAEHLKICPTKKEIARHMFASTAKPTGLIHKYEPTEKVVVDPDEENWDNEVGKRPAYNPELKHESCVIYKNMIGGGKAEKRKRRELAIETSKQITCEIERNSDQCVASDPRLLAKNSRYNRSTNETRDIYKQL